MKIVFVSGFSQPGEIFSELFTSLGSVLSDTSEIQMLSVSQFAKSDIENNISYADNLKNVLGNAEEIILIGWSLGGKICIDLATKLGNRLKGLILLSSSSCFLEKEDNKIGVPLGSYRALVKGVRSDKEAILPKFINSMFFDQSDSSQQFIKNALSVDEGLLLHNLEYLREDLREKLTSINIPCLILHGKNDKVIPVSHSLFCHKQIESSILHVYPECGHVPFMECPSKVVSDISNFLKTIFMDSSE